jgi:ubiquinone/menaquinone biosynthesis C-methylase UbiE
MTRDEWDRIFDELYLRTYAVLERGADPEPEALAAARLAEVEQGADLLDCPCGYGRHSIPLARAGFHVVGADRSWALLEEAERRAGEGEWPRWVHADHRELPFPDASFDAVLNLFSSLGYRGEEGDRQTLAEFRRVLRPGGALVVETLHRDRLASIFEPRKWEPLPDGGFVLEERRFDQAAGEIATTMHLLDAEGHHESATYGVRIYTTTELVRLVVAAGFEGVECFGGLEREELTIATRLVVLARAPE